MHRMKEKLTNIKIVFPWTGGISVHQKISRMRIAVHKPMAKYHLRKNGRQQRSHLSILPY